MKNRIGIIGGGQLGRMLGIAAKKMGFYVTVIDPTPNSPASQVVDAQIVADFTNKEAIQTLARQSDVITFEIELANANVLDELTHGEISIHPSPKTLLLIKDKLTQKQFLKKAKIPVAPFAQVQTKKDILNVVKTFGYPVLLKARFNAYDGRGNALIKTEKDIAPAIKKLEKRKLYVEKYIPFAKELAVMVARSIAGEIKTYPVVETVHENNICHVVLAPADISSSVRKKAEKLATSVMKNLKGAGVFGIEMFLTKKGEVLINEIAPRVHNSGHYTIEASATNQFEQHIRAITGLALGETPLTVPACVMVNILGKRHGSAKLAGLEKALKIPNVSVHVYGKAETRIDRKMGHITAVDTSTKKAYKKAIQARKYITI